MPRRRFQRASLAFSISSKRTMLIFRVSVWCRSSASWLSARFCFAMAEITRGRSDEFSDFMAVLEFGAVDLDDGAWIIEEVLGSCLHDARFARSRWSEEKESGNRPAGRCHSGHIHLIYVGNLFDCLRLPNDTAAEMRFQVLRLASHPGWIECGWPHDPNPPLSHLTDLTASVSNAEGIL